MQIVTANSVHVRFTIRDGDLEFTDALILTAEEFDAISEADLDARKVARFEAWKAIVTAPPVVQPPPTPEETQARIDALTQQQRETQAQLLALAPDDVMLGILNAQLVLVQDQITALSA